jgi:PAS domain S-box-containing protein
MQQHERRVLVLPLTRRDGEVTLALLQRAGLEGCVCDSMTALVAQVPHGMGAILLTEAALCDAAATDRLLAVLALQPAWSDMPIVALVRHGSPSPGMADVLGRLGNVTLLDRPASTRSMLSAVQSALRARQRQYQIRDQLQDQLQAQAALRRSEENFRVIVDLVPDLLWSNGPDGRADWYNRRWSQYTGQNAAALPAQDWMAAVHPEDLAETSASWQRAIHAQQPLVREHRIRRHDGAYRWHLVRAEPLRDAQGCVVRWFGSVTDIHEQHTTRELLEERVRQRTTELAAARDAAEAANRAKTAFLANMSHEIRTPLNAVIGLSELLLQRALPEEAGRFVRHIRDAGEQLLALVTDVLDLSRIEAGEMRLESVRFAPAPLLDAVCALVQPLADAKGLKLHLNVAPGLPAELIGDPLRLKQILINLAGNAVKFTPAGTVTLSARLQAQSSVQVLLQFDMADTGIGIALEAQERIFDTFTQADDSTTRRFGGSGLGLSIVRRLVDMMDGTLSLDSTTGQGSTFHVELPFRVA